MQAVMNPNSRFGHVMTRWVTLSLLGVLTVSVWAALPAAVEGVPVPSLAPMLVRAVPAVVNVSTVYSAAARNPMLDDPFFQWFFRDPGFERRYRGRSVGSGVIVDAARGYVLTNNHVVQIEGYADFIQTDASINPGNAGEHGPHGDEADRAYRFGSPCLHWYVSAGTDARTGTRSGISGACRRA